MGILFDIDSEAVDRNELKSVNIPFGSTKGGLNAGEWNERRGDAAYR
jgi:hypothetical protein